MSQPGITYEDVKAAADYLIQFEYKPTISAIRYVLGTGSNSTIAKHLNNYKNQHDPLNDSKPDKTLKLSANIICAIKILYAQIIEQENK